MYINKLARYLRPCGILILTLGIVACGGGGGGGAANVPGTLQISSTTYSATEGADSTVTITVTRTGGSSGAASADYVTSNDSAITPSDYTSTSGTLNWADGDSTSKTFSVTISDDGAAETTEGFSVSLTNVIGASLGTNSSATVTIIDNDHGVIHGKFIDAITGLQYVSGNQSGFTDINGGFDCEAGSTISFFVGDIFIGRSDCHATISPVEMVPGASDETHPTVSNIFAFLQTIDDDNDPSNGITITQAVINAAASQSINFGQSTADFAADSNVTNVVATLTAATAAGAHDLVGSSNAESDLNSILIASMAGIYNGTYTCDAPCIANGTWSMTIDENGIIAGSVCNVVAQIDFPISGSITSSGTSTIDATGIGGNGQFSGIVSHDGEFDGTWSTNDFSGLLIGSRQGVSVGGTCILPGGSLGITGTDTGTIDPSFIPVYDSLSYVTETQINIIAFDLNPFTSPGVDTRTLEIAFKTDGAPLGILFRLYRSGIPAPGIWGEYITICSQEDCSGASIDTGTQTITLSNAVVFPSNMSNNNATDILSLDGSFTYTISTP